MIDDFYSIVIPTMWCSDKLFDMLPIYNASDYVKEIIIIDNNPSKKGNIDFYDKVRYYTKGKNIFVNPSWNWGYSLSNYNLILANDDIIIGDFDNIMSLISKSDKDIIGVSLEDDGGSNKIEDIEIFPYNSYGCFMYIKNYIYIPEQIKIFYGDIILFLHNKKRGILKNLKIKTKVSETINSDNDFKIIINDDKKEYKGLDTRTERNDLNTIIRTWGKPNNFKKCINNIKKKYPYNKLHIIINNIKYLDYVIENIDTFDYNYYLINHDVIVNICKKFNIIEDNLIFDYYYNIVIPFLNNQYILIDDNKDF